MTTIRISSEELSPFYQCPEDAGQIVDVTYAIARDHEVLVCRMKDRSCGKVTMRCAELDFDEDQTFEPWNSKLPATYGGWDDCEVIES